MANSVFRYSSPYLNDADSDTFTGTQKEKQILKQITNEWNTRTCMSDLNKSWCKAKPITKDPNLLFLLYNVNSLNSHIADMDILINNHTPQICILTEIGKTVMRKLPNFPNYHLLAQEGTNSFGGVAILIHQSIKYKEISRELNFLLVEIETNPIPTLIGAVYVPPGSATPFHLFKKCRNKPFYIFGDYNAKHIDWKCSINNTSGNQIVAWLEETGNEMIVPENPTSRRSDAIIDFCLTHDAAGWQSEVIDDGTSDHFPILIQSPLSISPSAVFRTTNWKVFKFFLSLIYEYWLALVYNYEEQFFFTHFSSFLKSLWDRCSVYKSAKQYRPPWPPHLVVLAREVNRSRRRFRRNKSVPNLNSFLEIKAIFQDERSNVLQRKYDEKMEWILKDQNIWKIARPIFHSYSPPFRGLNINSVRVKDPKEIVDILAKHYEKHFAEPKHDEKNVIHQKCISIYEQISYIPNIPLESISITEVLKEWKRFSPKKSTDSVGTSAFLLKNLPEIYINIITILFNKCASKGEFFSAAKHAKVVCIPKEGIYPTPDKLRPISLLPNLGKCLERVIHSRILKWCMNMNIYIDEQSGFSPGRRLQTRIISLIEELRTTVAANNRPALIIFVDFLSAFDNMWIPYLITNLYELDMPLQILKWIFNWLKDRTFCIHHGDHESRVVSMKKGAPQGSVIAATLFRLHLHFITSYFNNIVIHLFADDLALILTGSLENKFSVNIAELEVRAAIVLKQLENLSDDLILPVNITKTKAVLVHNIVSPSYPKIYFKNQSIEFTNRFKYLGVYVSVKLGWEKYINERLKIISKIHSAMRIIFKTIKRKDMKIRRKIFFAYVLPHYLWLFATWFFFTDRQQE
jgi:uncharacterized protein (UPF0147 family)